mmetsp:Transcript_18472/g.37925  ORF Transcript_18472/g.37925 Transcript_18472/m.37925 type:complete len:250 (-) Transcript_18472:61-810(-)
MRANNWCWFGTDTRKRNDQAPIVRIDDAFLETGPAEGTVSSIVFKVGRNVTAAVLLLDQFKGISGGVAQNGLPAALVIEIFVNVLRDVGADADCTAAAAAIDRLQFLFGCHQHCRLAFLGSTGRLGRRRKVAGNSLLAAPFLPVGSAGTTPQQQGIGHGGCNRHQTLELPIVVVFAAANSTIAIAKFQATLRRPRCSRLVLAGSRHGNNLRSFVRCFVVSLFCCFVRSFVVSLACRTYYWSMISICLRR